MRKALAFHVRAPGNAVCRLALLTLAGLLASVPADAKAQSGQVGLPRFPSISPDGSELIFSWRGDLWRASSDGGEAVRLTRHNLDDLHSSWSPDGEWIVFASMRDGYLNLWRMRRDGSQLTQLTHGDQHLRNPSFGHDENGEPVITFSGMLEADVYRDQRPYLLSPEGGEYTRLHDAFGSEPQLSPDGKRVVFTRGGAYHDWNRRHYRGPDAMNVWLHELGTDRFEPLTERNGDDGMARWVDEDTLLFMSDREDQTVNLYRMELDAERTIERLTQFDEYDLQYFDVSQDGRTAVLQIWDTLMTLALGEPNAEPEPIALRAPDDGRDNHSLRRIDRDVSEAALSPDGQTMAYIAYGRVYVRHVDEQSPTRLVTPGTHARHHSLAWSPDGLRLYFVNDADGSESIYEARVTLTRDEVRRSHERQRARSRVSARHWDGDPSVSLASANANPDADLDPDHQEEPEEDYDPEYDPDLAMRGEEPEDPFAPQDPGFILDPVLIPRPGDPADVPPPPQEPQVEVESIPEEELEEEPPEDLPSNRDPTRWHDAIQFDISPVVADDTNDREVSPSPDGRFLAFRRGRGDLVILDLESGEERTLIEGWDSFMQWRWSPDSRYIAYSQNDLDFSANIFVVPADGSAAPVNITRHPRNDLNPRWSADSRKLTFISNRSGENYDLYRVYLDREIETYTPRELSTYYRNAREEARGRSPLPVDDNRESGEAAPDAAELDLENAWRRIERITATPTHQTANEMTPGGDRYVFNDGSTGLVAMDWDGSNRTRIGPTANVQQLNLTGEQVVYIVNGRVGVANLSGGGSPRYLDISDRLRIDLRQQALQKFHEAARVIGENFYRTDLKGLDWPAVVADYASLIRRARTSSEFSDIANRLMGELAASHMGVSNPGPVSALREPSGRLGIEYERIVSQQDGRLGYRVTEVLPEGPASRGPMPLARGDIITAIGLQPFEEHETLLQRLSGQVDREVIVTFDRPGEDGYTEYRTMLRTVGLAELARLKYDAFREESRRRVDELSDGRLGYLHIQAMNQTSLEGFQGDLYAAAEGKDGLIIDVRNNGGGNTTDRILTSIMAGAHAYTIPAGADRDETGHYPQDRLDAPRYTLPVNMLANEKSYSNAEILAHAFTTLERGTLVGQQTYGGVISTLSHTLIDGATVRRPFRGWYLPNGTDMEHNGAMPDLLVEQTPQDEVAERDRQLERAVADLLERIDGEE